VVTFAVMLAGALCAFGWGAIDCWRLGNRKAMVFSVIASVAFAAGLVGAIYLLVDRDVVQTCGARTCVSDAPHCLHTPRIAFQILGAAPP